MKTIRLHRWPHRLLLAVALFTLYCSLFVSEAQAQTIGEAFYIYRNDGGFNAFFRDEVDSMAYSHYDLDSVYYDENVTQLVYTPDSLYRIPLAAIDSIGFVQPETVYKDDVVQLSGNLFDYLVSADSLVLTFSSSVPPSLIPKVGDKLATMNLTDILPCGFSGKVRLVEGNSDVITVYCDSLAFEEAVSRFYGVVEIVSRQQDGEVRRYLPRKAPVATHTYTFNPQLRDFDLPVSLEGVISPKKVFKSYEGKASANMHITPTLTGRAVYVIDNWLVPTHYEIHIVTDLKTEGVIDVAGGAKGEFVNWWFDRDVPMPWGYPLYLAFGPMLEIEGDVALGFNLQADVRHIEDITYYPAASLNPVTQTLFNRVDQTTQFTRFGMDWRYFALRGSAKVGFKARVGLPVPKHEIAWFGGEFQFGERVDAELNVDFDAIEQAETGTAFYDALKSSNLSEMSYGGAQFCVMGLKDRLSAKFGRDDYDFGGRRINWNLLPIFSDTKATPSGSSAKASANITNDCIIPCTIGFSLFDENNNRIGEPQWNGQQYRLHQDFGFPFETTFRDLATDKKYRVFPTVRLFGLHNVLATPSAELDMHFPVTLSDFRVTRSQHEKGAFTHNGQKYDYCFNVSVTATLDADAEGVSEWGYVYLDPNGKEAFIPLNGHSYTDTRWAYYRNQPKSTCTLYGYVKYVGSDEPVYGEPHDYPLEYQGETTCPDSSHPHWIDLGLPSGTKWRCCNEGASTPEAYGGYYTFGQVASAPTLDQIREFLSYTTSVWTTQNGVNGRKFRSRVNGGTIFLPAAGGRWHGGLYDVGSGCVYWSSTPYDEYYAYVLDFISSYPSWDYDLYRVVGLSVRPVR
ncbi:MAG: hypothetical protein IJ841_04900 [Prevotella sp.]|nr:hypothetical protein [Prevotella sp.]